MTSSPSSMLQTAVAASAASRAPFCESDAASATPVKPASISRCTRSCSGGGVVRGGRPAPLVQRRPKAAAQKRTDARPRPFLPSVHHFLMPVVTITLALERDGGVLDVEFLAQHRLGVGEDLVVAAAVGAFAGDDDVGRERDHSAGDGPDVQVVHRGHALHARELARDVCDRDVARRALEQHVDGLAAEADGAPDDGAGDEEADDRVGRELPGVVDDDRREEHAHRVEQVASEVQEGGAQVHAGVFAAVRDPHAGGVERDAEAGEQHDRLHLDGLRVEQTLVALDGDARGDGEQQPAVHQRCEELHSTESGFTEGADGTRIHYSVVGAGSPALLCCDGIGCDGLAWKYLVRDFAATHKIVRWHYRGHGRSGIPQDRSHVGFDDISGDLEAVLRATHTPAAVFLGHSMGVQVALEYHRRHPEQVQALVLICGSHGLPLDTFHDSKALKIIFPSMLAAAEKYPQATDLIWRFAAGGELAYQIATHLEVNGKLVHREDFTPYFQVRGDQIGRAHV